MALGDGKGGFSVQPLPVLGAALQCKRDAAPGPERGWKASTWWWAVTSLPFPPSLAGWTPPMAQVLLGDGRGGFTGLDPRSTGLMLNGQVRDIQHISPEEPALPAHYPKRPGAPALSKSNQGKLRRTMYQNKWINIGLRVLMLVILAGCSSKKKMEHPLFEALDSKRTGLNFSNDLSYNKDFNLFKYMYFYNGSGVGAGDFNNDGLIDLFFGSNQHENKLYLNEGHLKFKDVTQAAHIPQDGGWSTGISVVDINNDGLLDIYICRVGNYEILHSKNQLLINQGVDKNGVPQFVDKAHEYGLDFSGFSTQAAFFDYDKDGDLDMFLLNHSVHENGTFRPRSEFVNTYHSLSGDRIFRNDGNVFTDVTKETGINSTAIGYGLGIAIADINLDGYPDIYVGNDFHENDYLYINQKNGTFKEDGEEELMHTSQFSMGVDVADVNNDAYPEIISVDMLPSDPYILKRSLGEDAYDIFNYKISVGYSHQYTRNNLQFNRRNGMFSEMGLYSGVAATDWSWAPLWVDFDNDGLKDLFISNGIPKRMNDIDYINFVSNGEDTAKDPDE